MRINRKQLLSLIVTTSTFANVSCVSEIDSCDLAFVLSGDGSFDNAISSATVNADSVKDYTHVGIVEICSEGEFILEAEPGAGVTRTPLQEFIEKNKNIDFYHVNGSFDKDNVIMKAKSFLGQKYDYTFLPDNGMLYCSELVYESFVDRSGRHIFPANPMNFLSKDGSLDNFWKELFADLEMEVPQGVPGTNPNDMSKSERLTLVKSIALSDNQ